MTDIPAPPLDAQLRHRNHRWWPPRPPGPSGVIRVIKALGSDPLAFLAEGQNRYGDLFYFRLGPMPIYMIAHPDMIEQVLVTDAEAYIKDWSTRDLSSILGNGLLTNEGASWKQQRRMAAPSLKRKQIEHYADIMVACTQRFCDQLRPGESRDVHSDMMQLTSEIVVKTLFDLDFATGGREVARAIDVAMDYWTTSTGNLIRFLLGPLAPVPRQFRQARAALHRIVADLIHQRRIRGQAGDEMPDDLLWRLMAARYEDGSAMPEALLRDEIITLFIAGHETTALALSYAWWLLATHRPVLQRLADEVTQVLGERLPGAADMSALPYAHAVIAESLRLYPPAWAVGREASWDTEIAGTPIPRGSQVWISQWLCHRDSRWFDEPQQFCPERWLDGLEQRLPRFAYFPFGGGARICIGNHFAMMEAVLILVTMLQRLYFERGSQVPLVLSPSVTLRPRYGVFLRPRLRGPRP